MYIRQSKSFVSANKCTIAKRLRLVFRIQTSLSALQDPGRSPISINREAHHTETRRSSVDAPRESSRQTSNFEDIPRTDVVTPKTTKTPNSSTRQSSRLYT